MNTKQTMRTIPPKNTSKWMAVEIDHGVGEEVSTTIHVKIEIHRVEKRIKPLTERVAITREAIGTAEIGIMCTKGLCCIRFFL